MTQPGQDPTVNSESLSFPRFCMLQVCRHGFVAVRQFNCSGKHNSVRASEIENPLYSWDTTSRHATRWCGQLSAPAKGIRKAKKQWHLGFDRCAGDQCAPHLPRVRLAAKGEKKMSSLARVTRTGLDERHYNDPTKTPAFALVVMPRQGSVTDTATGPIPCVCVEYLV
ncbi:hypothetical protein LY78DRAFT_223152 [Colletotrichum sublineola]|nr:hypothetical protein LY78DRAFT_223152 [Colletotrichum sublineola]